MSRTLVLWLTLTAALAAVCAGAVFFSTKPGVSVTSAGVSRGPIARDVLTSGTLEPAREVDTGAQVSGTVQALRADFNSIVKAGQILAELDPSAYDAELAQARAKLIQSEADVEQRQVLFDDADVKARRARELAAQDLITQAEVDGANLAVRQAAADRASARAAVKAARAMLAQAQLDRSHTVIRSPIDGIVVSRNVEVGQTLAARLQAPVLFRIADLRTMQMMTEVSEAEVGGVRPGSEVMFEIESLGPRQFKGIVSEVRLQPVLESGATGTSGATSTSGATGTSGTSGTSGTPGAPAATSQAAAPSATPASPAGSVVSYTAIVDVDDANEQIAPGTTAIVRLPTARRDDVLRVPNNALAFRPAPSVLESTGQASLRVPALDPENDPDMGRAGYVWKFEDGKFVPLEVRTGASDETWTEVLSGQVQPGDRIVTAATLNR